MKCAAVERRAGRGSTGYLSFSSLNIHTTKSVRTTNKVEVLTLFLINSDHWFSASPATAAEKENMLKHTRHEFTATPLIVLGEGEIRVDK
jgi:hypothetical protein